MRLIPILFLFTVINVFSQSKNHDGKYEFKIDGEMQK